MFVLFGIPVYFSWWFFLLLAVLGYRGDGLSPESMLDMGLFALAGTVSVLVHEFGHAFAGRRFGGVGPVIYLHGFGGICGFQQAKFTRKQDFFMTLAGPAAGYALGILALGLSIALPPDAPVKFVDLVSTTVFINFLWSTLNLLPVMPLDGGRMLQALLGPRRIKITLWIGLATAVILIPLAFKTGFLILPILLGYFAWQHFSALRGGK